MVKEPKLDEISDFYIDEYEDGCLSGMLRRVVW
jgi:hypothetical protein